MATDEPSSIVVNVGGNFTQENIPGQNAIGSNISQIQYTNCTFVYPNGSTKKGYSWIYTQGARPVINAERIFGREKELENIENLLNNKSALVITGFRGTGKSTLASMLVDRMGESKKFAGIYWRKVDETTDIWDIIGSFFTVIGKNAKDLEHYKIADQINLFFQELNEAFYLLVLDNFEILLDPQTNKPLESKVGFSELIEKANENNIRSKILFTSWDSIASERGISPFSYQIKGLDESAGILLLRHKGLLNESEAELKKAIDLAGGHPLALILLVQLVIRGAGELSDLLKEDSLWIGEGGEVAENILNKVYTERLSEDERKILQYVSIFRQPVPAKAIAKIANDPFWTESRVKRIAWKLCLKSLLLKSGEDYWVESLISKYVASLLYKNPEPHKLAMNYYLSLPIREKPAKKDDIQYLIEADYHACMAEEYDHALHILFDSKLHEYLDLWGNYSVLVELYSKLLHEDYVGKETLLEYKGNRGYVLGNLGNAYYSLGEPRKAIGYYEQALQIAKEIGNRRGEGSNLGNLGNVCRSLGDPNKAIKYYEQALEIDKEIEDRQGESADLGNMGNAYSDLKNPRKAIKYYKQALEIARELRNRRNEGIWLGNLGIAYRDLGDTRKAIEYHKRSLEINEEARNRHEKGITLAVLGNIYSRFIYSNPEETRKAIEYYKQSLKIGKETGDRQGEGANIEIMGNDSGLGESKKAVEYYEKALRIAKETGDRQEESTNLGNIANAYRNLGEPRKTIESYKQAIKSEEEIGDKQGEGLNLGNIGNAYSGLGDPRTAIKYYKQALKIAKETGDRRNEGIWLGNLGIAYRDLGDLKKAIEYYEQALEIAKEIGDRRGEENALGNLGLAYNHPSEISKMNKQNIQVLIIENLISDNRGKDADFGDLWTAYSDVGDPRKAIKYYKQALEISKDIGDKLSEGIWLRSLGSAYSRLGEVNKAIEYYEQALSFGEEIKDPYIINICKRNIKALKDSKK